MKIYHYHPDNGRYLGSGMADQDPLVEGNWLIPAHATDIQPPKSEPGKITVFNPDAQQWELIREPPAAVEDLPPEQQKDPLVLRAAAYADLFTGSDRYFIKAMRKRAAGDETGAVEAEQLGLARVAEIQLAYPIET